MFIGIGTRLRSYLRKGHSPIPPPVPGPDDFVDKNTDLAEIVHEFSTADNCIAFGVVVHRGTSSDLHATYDGIELERAVSDYNSDANIEVIIFYSNTATIGDGEFRLYCDTGEFGPVHVRLNEGEGFFYPGLSFTGHSYGEAAFPPKMTIDNDFPGKIKALTGYDRYDLSSAGILPPALTIGFRWASAWGTEIPGFDYSWENWTIPANVAEINLDGDLEFTGYGRVDISFPTGVLADPALDVGMDIVQTSLAFYGTRGTSARGYSFAAPVEYESFTMALGYGQDDCDGVRITSYPGNIVKMNSLTALDGVMSSLFVSGPSSDGLQIAFQLKYLVEYAQAAAQFLFGWQYLVDKSYNANDYSCYQTVMGIDRADDIGEPIGLYLTSPRDRLGIINKISNNLCKGAVSGSPGTLPARWIIASTVTGITRTIYDYEAIDGIMYVVLGFAGTATSTGSVQIAFDSTTAVPASQGEEFNFSVYMGAEKLTGVSNVRQNWIERTDAGAVVTSAYATAYALSLTPERFDRSYTVTGGSTVGAIQPRVDLAIISGAAVDFKIMLALPQISKGLTLFPAQETDIYLGGPGDHFGQSQSANRPTRGRFPKGLGIAGGTEGAGPYDITAPGVDSIICPYYGGSHWLTMGKPAAFNGCDYFVNGTKNFAWGFVFCSTSSGVIVACGGATEASRKLGVSLTSGGLQVVCRGAVTATSGTDYADGLPHVGLLVVIGADVKLYVDRNAPITVTVGSASNEATQQLLIGARDSTSPGGHYTGFGDLTLDHIGLIYPEEIEEWIEGECERVGVPV